MKGNLAPASHKREKNLIFVSLKNILQISMQPQIHKLIFIYFYTFFQEHPSLKGTPLAMLAAQCNKLSNKSPPPLADAAVGKGFHPWKKSPQQSSSGPHSPTHPSQNNNQNNLTQQRSISGSPMNNSTITPTRYVSEGKSILAELLKFSLKIIKKNNECIVIISNVNNVTDLF
jgi:hypothetical protein